MKNFFSIAVSIIGTVLALSFFVSIFFSWHHGHLFMAIVTTMLIVWGVFFEKLPKWVHITLAAAFCVPLFSRFFWAFTATRAGRRRLAARAANM